MSIIRQIQPMWFHVIITSTEKFRVSSKSLENFKFSINPLLLRNAQFYLLSYALFIYADFINDFLIN